MKLSYLMAGLLMMALCCGKIAPAQTTAFPDTSAMDMSVRPGDNFYLFVNGNWLKHAVIPPSEVMMGSAMDVYNKTKDNIHSILLRLAGTGNAPGSIEQKVGDFFLSGMDTVTIEKRGYEPVKPILAEIGTIKDADGIMQFVARQAMQGNSLLINFGIGSDEKNSSVNIAEFGQAGLGLPDRDYYFKTDPATLAIVKAYTTYITKMFMLTGDDEAAAIKKTSAIYELEKKIAASHRTRVELRDPQSNYNKLAVAALDKKMPAFEWSKTLATLGIHADSINIGQPAFYYKIDTLLASVPVDIWKDYLSFHTLNNSARLLSTPFVNTRFDYLKALYGIHQIKPRWERMSVAVDGNLGFALGKLYVEKYFTSDAKEKMLVLVNNLQKAFAARINNLDWMSDATKKTAIEKLYAFTKKIGYPDKWRDYSKVVIDKGKYFENVLSCEKNNYQYGLSKLGKPVDKTEWALTPPTVNAYYNPSFNEIVFPAGFLQPPFFDPSTDDALNYGAIGAVIGHEMTHGFDDEGAQFDKDGNLKNWWSKEDSARFVAKTKLVINQFNNLTVLDTVHINGELTTGENIADLGGLNIAYDAFKMTKEGHDTNKINGYTPDQRFFLAFAAMYRAKQTDALMLQLINTDPHSPNMARVNGTFSNFTPFYEAFNVKPGDKMYLPEKERIKIW